MNIVHQHGLEHNVQGSSMKLRTLAFRLCPAAGHMWSWICYGIRYITWGSHYWFRALSQAHPNGEVDPWSMTIDLPGAHSTGTSKVRLHCGTDMQTMEPYPVPRC